MDRSLAAGTLEGYRKRENSRCVPGVPGAVAWRTELLQAEFRVRKACRKKERPPVPNRNRYRKKSGERDFLGGMVSEPEFRRRAPRAPPGSFKGFMRTMPPVRWGAAMEVPFLFKGFLYGRAAQRRPYRNYQTVMIPPSLFPVARAAWFS